MEQNQHIDGYLKYLETFGLEIKNNTKHKSGFEIRKQKNLLVQVIVVNNRFGIKTMSFKMFNDEKVMEYIDELDFARTVANSLNKLLTEKEQQS